MIQSIGNVAMRKIAIRKCPIKMNIKKGRR